MAKGPLLMRMAKPFIWFGIKETWKKLCHLLSSLNSLVEDTIRIAVLSTKHQLPSIK
jgi:hypothetical protein